MQTILGRHRGADRRGLSGGSGAAILALLAISDRELALEAGVLVAQPLVLRAQRLQALAQRHLGAQRDRDRPDGNLRAPRPSLRVCGGVSTMKPVLARPTATCAHG